MAGDVDEENRKRDDRVMWCGQVSTGEPASLTDPGGTAVGKGHKLASLKKALSQRHGTLPSLNRWRQRARHSFARATMTNACRV